MSITFFKKFFGKADPAGCGGGKTPGFLRLIYRGGDL